MKSDHEDLSTTESLHIITSMIEQAKGNVQQQSFHLLLWGWVIVIANIGVYLLMKLNVPHPYLVWLITIPTFLVSMYYGYTKGKKQTVFTHLNYVSMWLWISFGITIFILVGFGSSIGYNIGPVTITILAIPTLVSGVILKFKPLVIGGIAFWISGVVAFLVPWELQNIIGAVAMIIGYLIPGYMLKYKSNH